MGPADYVALAWILFAFAVFFAAFYFSRDREGGKPASKAALPGGFKIIIGLAAAGLVLGVPAAVLSKTSDRLPSGAGTYTKDASQAMIDGRTIFRSTCASCHSLSAANARGIYGPNLDTVLGTPGADPKTIASRVSSAIANGGATGKQMPVKLLSGTDAELVSAYVGEVAGK